MDETQTDAAFPGDPTSGDPTPGEVAALGAAHDANQMLMVILGHAELLLSGATAVRWRDQVERIAAAAREAAAILRQALDERLGAESADREWSASPAVAARHACSVATASASPHDGVTARPRFRLDVADELTAAVPPLVLREILVNLVLNACAALDADGVVEIRGRQEAGTVVVEVADNGPGIPAAARADIFRALRGKRSRAGHGLGLPWARQLARRYGASLVLTGGGEAGTVFRLELPAAESSAAVLPAAERAAEHAVAQTQDAPAAFAGANTMPALDLLVVDDEALVREMIEEVLTALGHRVTAVSDGAEARARARSERFDAALIDLSLPGEDGLAVGRALKNRDDSLVVILMSGWGNERVAAAADPAIVDITANKPLEWHDLRRLAAEAARRRRSGTANPHDPST